MASAGIGRMAPSQVEGSLVLPVLRDTRRAVLQHHVLPCPCRAKLPPSRPSENATCPSAPPSPGGQPSSAMAWSRQTGPGLRRRLPCERLVCYAQDNSPPDPSSVPNTPDPRNADVKTAAASEAALLGEFCIIEGPDTLQDFARMQEEEIKDNIDSRRNKIFLLMEEIRRLRIQQRLRRLDRTRAGDELEEEDLPQYPSFIPFLPPLTSATLKEYYGTFIGLVILIIMFGGIVAPTLELKLGLGGTSYADFIQSLGLPSQLSEVDPIVASFSGGAVGVLSALLVVEVNNVKQQEHRKCMYCHGSGYLACARCSGTGAMPVQETSAAAGGLVQPAQMRCPNCAGSAKVMCPTCLCTGRALATEHDPRINPFD